VYQLDISAQKNIREQIVVLQPFAAGDVDNLKRHASVCVQEGDHADRRTAWTCPPALSALRS
jgi:hypothetical protein